MNVDRLGRGLAIAAGVVIVATVAAAVSLMGGPGQQRQARLDERRVADLGRIAAEVDAHVERTGALPTDLGVLAAQPGLVLPVADPVTGAPYVYAPGSGRRYRLCAVFATDTAVGDAALRHRDAWRHGAGRHCFDRRAPAVADRAIPPAAAG